MCSLWLVKVVLRRAFALLIAVLIAAPTLTWAKPPQSRPADAASEPAPEPRSLGGVVEAFNFSPKGEIESLMLKDGDNLVQVTFQGDVGLAVAEAVAIQDRVTIIGIPEKSVALHAVYRLVSLQTRSGRQIAVDGSARKTKAPKPDTAAAERTVHVEVKVIRLNYGKRGEVNGAIDRQGDFVHLGAEGATAFNLAVGQRLTVDGIARPMMRGRSVIEATAVNGFAVPRKPAPMKEPKTPKQPKTAVQAEQAPSAVMETIGKQAGSEALTRLEMETKDGRALYTARWGSGGAEREAKVSDDGAVVESKEAVAAAQLPDVVQATLKQTFPDAADMNCKKKTTYSSGEAVTVYEIKLTADGRKVPPIKIRSDGTMEQHGPQAKAPK